MKKWCLLILLQLTFAGFAQASKGVRDFQALVVSANDSFVTSEERLDYAHRDAERVAKAMRTAGRVPFGSIKHLKNPSTAEFNKAVQQLSRQKTKKFMFYYTGHSDEQGIHLKDGKIDRTKFHKILKKIPSKVKVVILDSCFSGALKVKGVRRSKAIDLVKYDHDEPTGSVILTSSSGNEFSYESENLKGSIFTYHLVSGLYGQADGNSDGRVTIDELYQYVYAQTKYQSMVSGGAVQSPEFLSKLSGQGSLVVSYPNKINGNIRLPKKMHGNLLLASSNGVTFFKFYKNKGESKTISVPRGNYAVRLEKDKHVGLGDIELLAKETIRLKEDNLKWEKRVLPKVKKKGKHGPETEFLFGIKFGGHPGYKDLYDSGSAGDLFLLSPAAHGLGGEWRAVLSLGGIDLKNSQEEKVKYGRTMVGGEYSFDGNLFMNNRWLIELMIGSMNSGTATTVHDSLNITRLSFGTRTFPQTMPLKFGLHLGFESVTANGKDVGNAGMLGISFSY